MRIEFEHKQSAHCESGVTSNLLYHYGLDITESMAFGIGAGLFFGYIPFIKLNKIPLTTFRCSVGGIFKRVSKSLKISVKEKRFRNQKKAMSELDSLLEQNIPVGCQTGAFWLPYFPEAFRFHFNMHNLIVVGKEGDTYFISDPVFPDIVTCSGFNLCKARFAKGTLAPKGRTYILEHVPESPDLVIPVRKGIKAVCNAMLKAPIPIIGVKGIRYLAGKLEKWPEKLGDEMALLYLGQVVRMQEEIGTGGGGFRFMYAAFLQQAASVLEDDNYLELSERLTQIGDKWRLFAVSGARNCKKRARKRDSFPGMAQMLRECADLEEQLFKDLRDIVV